MNDLSITSVVANWANQHQPGQGCVLLVRHGATEWNAARRLQGQTDVPLSPLGHNQAGEVAQAIYALDTKPMAVYSSPLARARVTAETIGQLLGVSVKFCNGLLERSFGQMEGLTTEEITQHFPRWRNDETTVPGLESFTNLQQRAVSAICGLLDEHPDQLFAAVSHGAFINAFLAAVSGGNVGTGKTNLGNGGVSIVWRSAKAWELGAINICTHISDQTKQTLPGR